MEVPLLNTDPGALPIRSGDRVPSQLSNELGSTQETTLLHVPIAVVTVISAGHTKAGCSASKIVTLKEQLIGPFPEGSETVYVIIVLPRGNEVPEFCPVLVGVKGPQLSVAIGAVQDTMLLHKPAALLDVISDGHTRTGFWSS
jgi:hypothetical protein